MIFSDIYPRPVAEMILDGSKCQTRRLVKEGDIETYARLFEDKYKIKNLKNSDTAVRTNKGLKWCVGRDYAVQLGGKAGLWYCPECNWNGIPPELPTLSSPTYHKCQMPSFPALKPLRIKITGIRKEHLQDIRESDAKKEGFEKEGIFSARDNFLKAMIKTSWNSIPKSMKVKEAITGDKTVVDLGLWNPEVFVLDFEVKKCLSE